MTDRRKTQLDKSGCGRGTDDHSLFPFHPIIRGPFTLPGGDTQHFEHKLKVIFLYSPFQDIRENTFEIVEAKSSNIKPMNVKR